MTQELHEFRVRPVVRYIVTSFNRSEDGRSQDGRSHGEFENADTAYQVAYALCRQEHERLGFPPGDMRIQYPEPLVPSMEISRQVEPTVFNERPDDSSTA